MSRATQQNCIDFMQEALDYNQTATTSVWDFSGNPINFIKKAEAQGLVYIDKCNDDLIFSRKN